MVAVGAHLDHLGHGEAAGSLARTDERGEVHFGADDNASGVAGLLAVARSLARLKAEGTLRAERDVLFAAWSGEELGLLGSTHFVERLLAGMGAGGALSRRVAAYLNMDMIGRLEDRLTLQGIGSSSDRPFEIERANVAVGLAIATSRDAYLPTDTTPFYVKGVPVLNAFTGAHSEYSTPRDTAERINFAGTAQVARLMAGLTAALARREQAPAYVKQERPKGAVGRRHIRVYLGTIPDYAQTDAKGVKLSDVAKGGPAEAAGLRGGDVIVGLAGTAVDNIYDFMGTLNLLKAGEATSIKVERGAERLTFSITPAARE